MTEIRSLRTLPTTFTVAASVAHIFFSHVRHTPSSSSVFNLKTYAKRYPSSPFVKTSCRCTLQLLVQFVCIRCALYPPLNTPVPPEATLFLLPASLLKFSSPGKQHSKPYNTVFSSFSELFSGWHRLYHPSFHISSLNSRHPLFLVLYPASPAPWSFPWDFRSTSFLSICR